MKTFRSIKAGVLLTCLLGSATAAWSDDIVSPGKNAQEVVGREAVVAKIGRDAVTLRSATDSNKEITIPSSNAEEFKVGDKVKVQGNIFKKLGDVAEPANPTATESGSSTGAR